MLSHILLKLYILQYQLYRGKKKRRGDKLPDLRHGIACIFQQKKKDDANNDHDRPIHVSLLSNFNKFF